MQKRVNLTIGLVIFLWLLACIWNVSSLCAAIKGSESTISKSQLPENYSPGQVDEILSAMSDEQVRQLLIVELKKAAAGSKKKQLGSDNNMHNLTDLAHARFKAFISNIPNMPSHFYNSLVLLSESRGVFSLFKTLIYVLGVILVGLLFEFFFKYMTRGFHENINAFEPMKGFGKIGSALLKIIPDFFNMAVFIFVCLTIFFLLKEQSHMAGKIIFLIVFIVIISVRMISLLSSAVCSPTMENLRLLSLSNYSAKYLHKSMMFITGLISFGYVITSAMIRIGAPKDLTKFTGLSIGTFLILTMAFMILQNRKTLEAVIIGNQKNPSLFKKQFAAIWHILSFAYIIIIWALWAADMIIGQDNTPIAFFISLLIVPIYLLLDKAGQWIVGVILGTLKEPEDKTTEDHDQTVLENNRNSNIVATIIRVTIVITLILWIASLWGVDIPFVRQLPNTMFDVMVTLILGYHTWNFLSRLIDKKLAEDMPDKDENEEEDNEWGSGAIEGRSTTVLPMVKKFIGAVLIVVVLLTILSSIGVEIAPLLAGAGVIGIAIGFGAQKLVTDILSGFFFLLDDAFRVGEYIEAGGISGSVEAITLRNVKLRHHRGMLQLVPFGELGSVTNYMRGGMIIKFNIQLPYDTDIDKVRKIIKKVGQAMIKDEEFKDDFIRPVKSQGVREVGDSVMTFRVKFTVHPGKQFVIKREAFRRITEALAAQGIHYAHRKVIVDMPDELKSIMGETDNGNKGVDMADAETSLKLGAAAAVDGIIRREETKKAEELKK